MNMENGPHLVVTDPTVLDMLFSQNSSHFELFFQDADEESTQKLLDQNQTFWLDLFNTTFTSPRALVLAYPSQKYDNELASMEAERLKKQVVITCSLKKNFGLTTYITSAKKECI
jgi:hypothetical protein